jgi:hypothetical protein
MEQDASEHVLAAILGLTALYMLVRAAWACWFPKDTK